MGNYHREGAGFGNKYSKGLFLFQKCHGDQSDLTAVSFCTFFISFFCKSQFLMFFFFRKLFHQLRRLQSGPVPPCTPGRISPFLFVFHWRKKEKSSTQLFLENRYFIEHPRGCFPDHYNFVLFTSWLNRCRSYISS